MSSPPPTFLIVGATGQQGGAVLTALSKLLSEGHKNAATTPRPKILALTRSAPDSPKAQALTSKYPALDLTVVQGDTKDPGPIFAAHPDIGSVFLYTTPPDEEVQALPLLDYVFFSPDSKSRVHHIVFSSVDRGGDAASWENPTEVAHFKSKHEIEVRLRDLCTLKASQKVKYTILRPVAFMDNLNPGSLFGPVFASMWATMPAEKPLQLVSVRDIGLFGAKALLAGADGDDGKWSNKAIGLAGQEVRFEEAREIFRRVSAGQKEMPQAPWIIGKGVRWAIGEVGTMFRFFEEEGYGADIDALRTQEPELQDLETWLKETSKFEFDGAA
ncbi:nucleoside-diphosphate-sugar epimerase family protein [Apiospora aurea]|uniref:Nucleoside-diphosphate-sugar epimerase family protein n=1 Tax=Apiospora aurea TaxID=335848 RepID=A0ABR1Q8P2_9PEZI